MPQNVPLTMGSYSARSIIAAAQCCVNAYGEKNPDDSPFPYTFYPTPGLVPLWTPPLAAPARCLYTASSGDLYYVVGSAVYYVPPSWMPMQIGTLSTTTTPVSIKDNGFTAIIVDGTTQGFLIDLPSRVMTPYTDPNFLGADRVDYNEEFFIFNQPNSRNFYTSLINSTTLDGTYIAAKSLGSDNISRAFCIEGLIYLLGAVTSEVWSDAGAPLFPFQLVPGSLIQHGAIAPYSLATHGNVGYFVEQNKDGRGVIAQMNGYSSKRISTPAIEAAIAKYPTLTDAVGFCYSLLGHVYYVVTFPSADKTWSFDLSQMIKVGDQMLPMAHEWNWADSDGLLHRTRAAVGASAYGINVVGDWENGTLYQLDPFTYNDFGGPIIRKRGFPHLTGRGRLCEYDQFQAEMEVGQNISPDAQVSLLLSNTRGASWGQPWLRDMGGPGDYLRVPQWRQLGLARDMVFQLEWSFDASWALNGGYVDFTPTDA